MSLTTFYAGWPVYQQRLVDAVAPLTLENLALSAAPHTWTVGKIAAHVIAARVWWFHSRMGEGNANLAPLEHWDNRREPLRQALELVDGLARTWQMIETALACWTPAELGHVFPARRDDPTVRTREWVVWHTLEHDLFHGGEISCILGAHGLRAVDLE